MFGKRAKRNRTPATEKHTSSNGNMAKTMNMIERSSEHGVSPKFLLIFMLSKIVKVREKYGSMSGELVKDLKSKG